MNVAFSMRANGEKYIEFCYRDVINVRINILLGR